MSDRFYRSFEERYYAPREVIKSLRRQYFPFVQPIANLYRGAATFDVGCGRGEWLELMSELQLTPFGVDLDDGMLSACVEFDLAAEKGDAIERIATFEDSSQAIVTAFHVVEHITFDQLRTLISEALRVLKPGGVLIMETPNPENLLVATSNFYLDPTHQRPIPPKLLSFVAEYAGFARTKTLRLQEQESLRQRSAITLSDVFKGVSPDYAIVAQKSASEDVLALLDEPFSVEFGLSQDELLSRFDEHIVERIERVVESTQQAEPRVQLAEEKAQNAGERAQRAEEKAHNAAERAQRAEQKAQCAEEKAQHALGKAQFAEEKAQQAEAALSESSTRLHAIYASRSWRITAPLRWICHQFRMLRQQGPNKRLKAAIKKVLLRLMAFVVDKPRLKGIAIASASRFGLADRLQRIYRGSPPSGHMRFYHKKPIIGLNTLPPRAERIYQELREATEDKKGSN